MHKEFGIHCGLEQNMNVVSRMNLHCIDSIAGSHDGNHVSKRREDMVFIPVFPIVLMKQKGGRCQNIRST